MARKIVILDNAKEEFRDIKAYVKRQFGDAVWNVANAEYKHSLQLIKTNPNIGHVIDGLKARCDFFHQRRYCSGLLSLSSQLLNCLHGWCR